MSDDSALGGGLGGLGGSFPKPSDLRAKETDPRFPSGRWVGFFLQKIVPPGKFSMELDAEFRDGRIQAHGRDLIGKFSFQGTYDLASGVCTWTKTYAVKGKFPVDYRGFNEGRGIWGNWSIGSDHRGGFYIWPEGMADPTQPRQSAGADVPLDDVPVLVTTGVGSSEVGLIPPDADADGEL